MNLVFRKLEKEDRDYELIWLIIGGLALLFLYFFLEHIHRNVHCLFKKITSVPCLTCGMVRAFISLCEPDPVRAFLYNPLATVIYIFLGMYLVYAAAAVLFNTNRLRIDPADRRLSAAARGLILFLLAANWLYLVFTGR